MNFIPTKEQIMAFKKVEKAIKNAKKQGLVFYGKSGNLVAYTNDADSYIHEHGYEKCFCDSTMQIPCIAEPDLISDSGADDYPRFVSKSDEERYI